MIQDRYKPDVYVITGHHEKPNVYYIQLLNKPGQPKVVNRHQLFDLNRSVPPSASSTIDDGSAVVPSFLNNHGTKSNTFNFSNEHTPHLYNTHSKCKAVATSRQVEVETMVTHL